MLSFSHPFHHSQWEDVKEPSWWDNTNRAKIGCILYKAGKHRVLVLLLLLGGTAQPMLWSINALHVTGNNSCRYDPRFNPIQLSQQKTVSHVITMCHLSSIEEDPPVLSLMARLLPFFRMMSSWNMAGHEGLGGDSTVLGPTMLMPCEDRKMC